MNEDIKDLLIAWGEWARNGEEQLGFKNSWQTIFAMAPEADHGAQKRISSKKEVMFICDRNASRIDRIVSSMPRSMLLCRIAITARYVDLASIDAIGRGELAVHVHGKDSKTSVGKHKVRELLAKGEGYIEGMLSSVQ